MLVSAGIYQCMRVACWYMEPAVMYVDVATRHCTLIRTAQRRQATTSAMKSIRINTKSEIVRYPRKAGGL